MNGTELQDRVEEARDEYNTAVELAEEEALSAAEDIRDEASSLEDAEELLDKALDDYKDALDYAEEVYEAALTALGLSTDQVEYPELWVSAYPDDTAAEAWGIGTERFESEAA